MGQQDLLVHQKLLFQACEMNVSEGVLVYFLLICDGCRNHTEALPEVVSKKTNEITL